jgi:hypothetical protein
LSLLTTLVAASLARPADMEVLVKFYAKVRPFGFWGPVRRECVRRGLVPANDKMPRMDVLNGFITAGFQFSLAVLPFYLFLRNWKQLGIWAAGAAALAFVLYFTWYKNLPSKNEI